MADDSDHGPDSPKDGPEGTPEDALERLADELLQDPELFAASTAGDGSGDSDSDSDSGSDSDRESDGGLTWIRSTLREGGDADDPLLGTLFHDKYRVLRKIGAGGFGAVYEAIDERGARNRVALKVMLPGAAQSDAPLETFRGEAVRVTRLNHPHIVDWKSFDRTPDGRHYFVMELLEGEDLHTVLNREGTLEWRRTGRLVLQILGALRAAHFVGEGQSILHLDLKPKNILLLPERRSRPETAKVIDFGIGQYLGGEDLGPVEGSGDQAPPPVPARRPVEYSTVTSRTDTVANFERRAAAYPFKISQACTPEYASPEHCAHILFADGAELEPEALDGRADLYSLGVIAYQLLTGRLPFAKPAHRFQYLELHRSAPTDGWGESEALVPRRLRQWVERCLEKDPARRFGDAQEAHEALEEALRSPMRRWLTAAAVVVLVSAGVLLAQLVAPRRDMLQLVGPGDGAQEVGDTLHAGPNRMRLPLRLVLEGTSDPFPVDPDRLLLQDDGDRPLSGWTVEAGSAPGELVLVAQAHLAADLTGREAWSGLRLVDPRDELRVTTLLQLVWLGTQAWEGHWHVGGEVLAAEAAQSPPRVDTEGLELAFVLPALDPEDLPPEGATLTVGGEAVDLRLDTVAEGVGLVGTLQHRRSGSLQCKLVVPGPAGDQHTRMLILEGVSEAMTVRAWGVESAQRERPWSPDDPLLLPEGSSAQLGLESNVAASWVSAELGRGDLVPGERALVALSGVLDTMATNDSRRLTLTFDDGVLSSPEQDGRHRQPLELELELTAGREVRIQLAVPGREPPDGGTATSGPEDAPELVLETPVPLRRLRLDVRVAPAGSSPRERAHVVLRPQSPRTPLPLRELGLTRDGLYEITVEAFEVDADGVARTDLPVATQLLPLRVDRTPPTLHLEEEPQEPLLVLAAESGFPLFLSTPDDGGSAATVQWRAEGPQGQILGPFSAERAAQAHGSWRVHPLVQAPAEAWPDGAWSLEVEALDRGGNASQLAALSFEVALEGPSLLQLRTPDIPLGQAPPLDWPREELRLTPLRLEASDPNGLGTLRCFLHRSPNEPASPFADLGGVELDLELETSEAAELLLASFEPSSDWSGARDVWICVAARDRHGALREEAWGPFRLPTVAPEPPPLELNGALLVPVDPRAEYLFKGRNTDDERRGFEAAGLPSLWEPPGIARSGVSESPWAIPVPPGALPPYRLDPQPVSNREFLAFLEESAGYRDPGHWLLWARPDEDRRRALVDRIREQEPGAPVTDVRLVEADAYARFRGKRLPSLLELEYAARAGAHYLPMAWDAGLPVPESLPDDWRLWRGLSRGAEWSSTPAHWPDEQPAPPRPWSGPGASLDLFLPRAQAGLEHADRVWVRGSLPGAGTLATQGLRHDFAAVDAVPSRGWSHPRVGFRCAASVSSPASPR